MFGINKRVDRGVALLDAQVPGWESRVNADRIDITSGRNCVLGQVFERGYVFNTGYLIGRTRLGLDGVGSRKHGFNALTVPGYPLLTWRWRKVVRARQAEKARAEAEAEARCVALAEAIVRKAALLEDMRERINR